MISASMYLLLILKILITNDIVTLFYYYSFPGATNETLLQKFNTVHKDNKFYEKPQRREPAFIVNHYAGRVKYQVRIYK